MVEDKSDDKVQNDSDESAVDDTVVAVSPDVWIDHDEKTYFIEIELPGVRKEHIDLSIGEQSICIQAARADEPIVYIGCFSLAHPVNEDKATAKFQNWTLKIEVPLKAPLTAKRIRIE